MESTIGEQHVLTAEAAIQAHHHAPDRRRRDPGRAGGPLNLLFAAVISAQLKRIEGDAPLFTCSQLAGGAALAILFILPAQLWSVIAFRPEREPGLMLLYNDLAWFLIVMPFGVIGVQNTSIGFAILNDRNTQPIFQRWTACSPSGSASRLSARGIS